MITREFKSCIWSTGLFLFFVFSTIFSVQNANGQARIFAPEFTRIPDSIETDVKSRYHVDQYDHGFKGKAEKYFEQMCESKANYFELLCEDEIIVDEYLNEMIREVQNKLESSNKQLQPNYFRIYISKSYVPNAFSMGKGVVVLNYGLLRRLRTEDELAFVIAHEMGHDILQHGFKGMVRRTKVATDKSIKQETKDAAKGRSDETPASIFRRLYKAELRYSRRDEYQADSIGYEWLVGGGFNAAASVQVMNILDSADYFLRYNEINLRELLNSRFKPFNQNWLNDENQRQSWTRNDSLYLVPENMKTHPNASSRVDVFETKWGIQDGRSPIQIDSLHKHYIEYATIETLRQQGYYSMAAHNAMQMLLVRPHDVYLKCVLAESLAQMGYAIKNSTFSNTTDFPDQHFPASYNQWLTFLHNMSSKKLFAIFRGYYEENLQMAQENSFGEYLSILNNIIVDEEFDTDKAIEEYESKYPESRFLDKLDQFKSK